MDKKTKSTGIVRKIDELGRIVLPIEIRRTLGIEIKDPIEIYTEEDKIILKKYQPTCLFCGSDKDLKQLKDKNICLNCLEQLSKIERKEK